MSQTRMPLSDGLTYALATRSYRDRLSSKEVPKPRPRFRERHQATLAFDRQAAAALSYKRAQA